MAEDPTEAGAVPEAERVSDDVHALVEADRGANVADIAEAVADAMFSDTSLGEALASRESSAVLLEAPVRAATRRRSGRMIEASPLLGMPRASEPKAIALFVHGGDVTSHIPARRGDPAYLRMVPFARDVERRSRHAIGSAILRLSMRGWNDPDLPALEDTQWALRVLRERHPGVPIALVGHSMGGRVILHLGDEAEVDALVGLAPWAADEYDPGAFARTPLLIIHGRRDTVTDPNASQELVRRIAEAGGDATFVSMPGWHAMLWQAAEWHGATSRFLIDRLGVMSGR